MRPGRRRKNARHAAHRLRAAARRMARGMAEGEDHAFVDALAAHVAEVRTQIDDFRLEEGIRVLRAAILAPTTGRNPPFVCPLCHHVGDHVAGCQLEGIA